MLEVHVALALLALGFGGLAAMLDIQARQQVLLERRPQASVFLENDLSSYIATHSTTAPSQGALVQVLTVSASASDNVSATVVRWAATP